MGFVNGMHDCPPGFVESGDPTIPCWAVTPPQIGPAITPPYLAPGVLFPTSPVSPALPPGAGRIPTAPKEPVPPTPAQAYPSIFGPGAPSSGLLWIGVGVAALLLLKGKR